MGQQKKRVVKTDRWNNATCKNKTENSERASEQAEKGRAPSCLLSLMTSICHLAKPEKDSGTSTNHKMANGLECFVRRKMLEAGNFLRLCVSVSVF